MSHDDQGVLIMYKVIWFIFQRKDNDYVLLLPKERHNKSGIMISPPLGKYLLPINSLFLLPTTRQYP